MVCMGFFCSYCSDLTGPPHREVRDVQGSSMHNEYLSSVHSTGESHKSLKWKESSGKGKTGKTPLALSQVTLRLPQLLFTV